MGSRTILKLLFVFRIMLVSFMLMIFSFRYSFPQNPDDNIDMYDVNLNLIEHLVKIKLDSIRRVYHLSSLYDDSICYLAAKDQAYYLMDITDIVHYQTNNPVKETPQKRVEYYGGSGYQAGENIIKIYLFRPTLYVQGMTAPKSIVVSSYRDAVDLIVYAWVNSAEHFINIVSGSYNATGVSALFNEDDFSLVCVQVFAKAEKYALQDINSPDNNSAERNNKNIDSQNNIVVSPYLNKYNLKYPPPTRETEAVKNFIKSISNWSVVNKGSHVYVNLGNIENAKRFFFQSNDGFAIEMVPLDKYNCNSDLYYTLPRRKNGRNILEGHTSKPVYRDELFKTKNEYSGKNEGDFFPCIGTLPKNISSPYELNILIIKNNYISEIVYTNHFCVEYKDYINDVPLLTKYNNPDSNKELPGFVRAAFLNEQNEDIIENGVWDKKSLTNIPCSFIINEYRDLYNYYFKIYPLNNTEAKEKTLLRLDSLQNYLFNEYIRNKINFQSIDSLPWLFKDFTGKTGKNQPLAGLYYNRMIFKYNYLHGQIADTGLFKITRKLRFFDNPKAEIIYNYYAYLIKEIRENNLNYNSIGNLLELNDVLEKIKDKIPRENYDALSLFYHLWYIQEIRLRMKSYDNLITPSLDYIYSYFMNHKAPAEDRVLIAKYFVTFRQDQYALDVLSPLLEKQNLNKEAYILYLKLYYSGKVDFNNHGDYYHKLIEASDILPPEEWVGLFDGPCRLNLQLLDYEPLFNIYCNKVRQF